LLLLTAWHCLLRDHRSQYQAVQLSGGTSSLLSPDGTLRLPDGTVNVADSAPAAPHGANTLPEGWTVDPNTAPATVPAAPALEHAGAPDPGFRPGGSPDAGPGYSGIHTDPGLPHTGGPHSGGPAGPVASHADPVGPSATHTDPGGPGGGPTGPAGPGANHLDTGGSHFDSGSNHADSGANHADAGANHTDAGTHTDTGPAGGAVDQADTGAHGSADPANPPGDSLPSPDNWDNLTPDEMHRLASDEVSRGTVPFANDADAARYGAAYWNDYADNLSPSQKEAFLDYTKEMNPGGVTYHEINGYLRGNDSLGSPGVLHDVAEIDRAMAARPIPEDVMVVRGTGLGHLNLSSPLDMEGRVFPDGAYMSTSLGDQPVAAFADKEAILRLRVPKDTPAMWVERVSELGGGERELLLGRGSAFKVTRVFWDNDQWQVYGEILPKKP